MSFAILETRRFDLTNAEGKALLRWAKAQGKAGVPFVQAFLDSAQRGKLRRGEPISIHAAGFGAADVSNAIHNALIDAGLKPEPID